ncbi:protein kinase family protein [Glycomyces tarimensis]
MTQTPEAELPHSAAPADLDALTGLYQLGDIHEIRYLPDGRMNRNWRIDCTRGHFALKHLTDQDTVLVRRNLGLLDRIAAAGVPIAGPVAATTGELLPEVGGRHYYLCEWVDGSHLGPEMTLAQAAHMGAVIGHVHRALADPALGLPVPQPRTADVTHPDAALAETERFLQLAAGRPETDDFDRAAVPVLRRRLGLITAHAHLRPETSVVAGPQGWTHGDCQDWNLIWTDGRIGAVIDWDRVRVRPYAEELVRAATWQFYGPDGRIDLTRVAALLSGYRSVCRIDREALADAARRRWWKMLSHCWHLDFHYDRGDRSCDDLFFSDERMVTWWTANREAVEATFATPC